MERQFISAIFREVFKKSLSCECNGSGRKVHKEVVNISCAKNDKCRLTEVRWVCFLTLVLGN